MASPTLEELFEDLESRFLLNLPEEELASGERLFFQVEQAFWFYEDFYADAHTHLPHYKLNGFARECFNRCQLLSPLAHRFDELFGDFKNYRGSIPCFGCILLNARMDQMVLVQSYNTNHWGFPKGKINQNESPAACAARESLEETGFDASDLVKEEDYLTASVNKTLLRMYVVQGVPEDYNFETQTRKEISKIQFFPVNQPPGRNWSIQPFLGPLKRFIKKRKKQQKKRNKTPPPQRPAPAQAEESKASAVRALTVEDLEREALRSAAPAAASGRGGAAGLPDLRRDYFRLPPFDAARISADLGADLERLSAALLSRAQGEQRARPK